MAITTDHSSETTLISALVIGFTDTRCPNDVNRSFAKGELDLVVANSVK